MSCLKKGFILIWGCRREIGKFLPHIPPNSQSNSVLSNVFLSRYKKSVAQLLIRWSLQKMYITIPKSSNPERIVENSRVFDFEITESDMKVLVGVKLRSSSQI